MKQNLPNAEQFHDPDPAVAACLYARIGLPMADVSAAVGVAVRTLRCYKADGESFLPMPYSVQYALETLANAASRKHNRNTATPDRKRGA